MELHPEKRVEAGGVGVAYRWSGRLQLTWYRPGKQPAGRWRKAAQLCPPHLWPDERRRAVVFELMFRRCWATSPTAVWDENSTAQRTCTIRDLEVNLCPYESRRNFRREKRSHGSATGTNHFPAWDCQRWCNCWMSQRDTPKKLKTKTSELSAVGSNVPDIQLHKQPHLSPFYKGEPSRWKWRRRTADLVKPTCWQRCLSPAWMIDDSSALKWKKQHFHLNQNRSNFPETAKPEQKINNTKSLHAEQSLAGGWPSSSPKSRLSTVVWVLLYSWGSSFQTDEAAAFFFLTNLLNFIPRKERGYIVWLLKKKTKKTLLKSSLNATSR